MPWVIVAVTLISIEGIAIIAAAAAAAAAAAHY
jgi:hypothetical protein